MVGRKIYRSQNALRRSATSRGYKVSPPSSLGTTKKKIVRISERNSTRCKRSLLAAIYLSTEILAESVS